MKKIININILVMLFGSLLVFNSCAVDDDAAIVATANELVEISVPAAVLRVPENSGVVSIPLNLSKVVNQLAKVSYTVDGTTFTKELNTGSTSVNVDVDMTGMLTRELIITDFKMLYADADGFDTGILTGSETMTIVNGDDNFIIMTWDTGTDIDLALTSGTPDVPLIQGSANVVDLSISVAPSETVVLPGSSTDGDYIGSIVPFSAFSIVINFEITVIAGDQSATFNRSESEGLAASGGFFTPISYPTVIPIVNINKAGTTYTITEL